MISPTALRKQFSMETGYLFVLSLSIGSKYDIVQLLKATHFRASSIYFISLKQSKILSVGRSLLVTINM